ncbi:MAG TPA: amidohydrolase family protein [Gemmatimonadaceae bacterium]|nr:amidohydrolase family protein [Gemmatimonadaceae bacterium]
MTHRLTNVHIHTFNRQHVPRGFVPLGLGRALEVPGLRGAAAAVLTRVGTREFRGLAARYRDFLRIAHSESQEDIFRIVESRYPRDARFVVLPMDLAYMGRGRPRADLDAQHDELRRLAAEHPGRVLPFVAVDPRRPQLLEMLRRRIEDDGFRGLKVYPNLGYAPDDPVLRPVFAYAADRNLPVMAHCSRGGVRFKNASDAQVAAWGAPDAWLPVLREFPTLRVCLAHFGGAEEWDRYFGNGWTRDDGPDTQSWLARILDLLRGEFAGKNLWTDISYTIFHFEHYAPALKVFLSDPRVAERVLFGSDFYMAQREDFEERLLSMRLRAELGEELFWRIAEENPERWLGERD